MRVVLDSAGVTALAAPTHRARVAQLANAVTGPLVVPAPVLVECLTGDPRRDHRANRLLRTSEVVALDEVTAREAARLRTLAARRSISAVDATVVAVAAGLRDREVTIVTADVSDISALAAHVDRPLLVRRP